MPLQQYIIDRLYSRSLAASLEQAFRDTLADVQNPRIRKLTLRKFDAGQAPPKLAALNERLLNADAYVAVTPEYNHAPSPALLNTINHIGSSVMSYKPSLICS